MTWGDILIALVLLGLAGWLRDICKELREARKELRGIYAELQAARTQDFPRGDPNAP